MSRPACQEKLKVNIIIIFEFHKNKGGAVTPRERIVTALMHREPARFSTLLSEYFRRMIISFFLEKKLINEKLARKLSTP